MTVSLKHLPPHAPSSWITTPPDADIWHLRYHWSRTRDALLTRLLTGEYRLRPMLLTKKRPQKDRQVMWGAQDALVLKWVALLITPHLDLHPRCEHVKGHGGGPQSVQRMAEAIQSHRYEWVCRTDVKGYYRHIRKDRLMAQVRKQIADPVLQALIDQYVHYTVEDGGEFYTPSSGIARGCALSPLMGAMHLYAMDAWFEAQVERATQQKKKGIYYARYMDDIVILAHSRWQLRRQVRALNGFFNEAGFSQHPDKTFIGRTERGYDWMGAQMNDVGVEGIAHRARVNHLERLRRLYEQVRRWPAARRRARMSQYRAKWKIWAFGLLALAAGAPAHAGIGTPGDLDVGIRACIARGDLAAKGNGYWGGTCDIHLTQRAWQPSRTYPSVGANPGQGGRLYGQLSWPSMGSGEQVQLTINQTLDLYCNINPPSPSMNYGTARWAAGSVFNTTTNTSTPDVSWQIAGQQTYCDYPSSPYVPHPTDGYSVGYGFNSPHSIGYLPSGTLRYVANVPLGSVIKYPNVTLFLGVGQPVLGPAVTIGIGGSGGTDPTPTNPPFAGDPPNCSAISGVSNANYTFGTASAGATIAELTTSVNVAPHNLSLQCTSGPNGSVAANATLSVQSSSAISADGQTLMSDTSDWIGLRLYLPASNPSSSTVALANGQTWGQPVKWNGGAATPLWTWAIPERQAKNASVNPVTVRLAPQIWQLQAAPGSKDGSRSYSVTYSVNVQ